MGRPMAHQKSYGCVGLDMPQPTDAPEEGYLPCYVAGHRCMADSDSVIEEGRVKSVSFCPCCGHVWAMSNVPARRTRPAR